MKYRSFKKAALILLSATILTQSCTAFAGVKMNDTSLRAVPQPLTGEIITDNISKFGNVKTSITCEDILKAGYQYGDMVTLSFLDKTVDIPFGSSYTDVDTGEAILLAHKDDTLTKGVINMGDFASTYGIAVKSVAEDGSVSWSYPEGVEGPIKCTISTKEPGGYYGAYVAHQLAYTDERSDYPSLSDEEFANFRVVATSGMGKNTLYRTSSPVDPEHKRNTYADEALARYGVNVILNLGDAESTLQAFPGYNDTYYHTVSHLAVNLGMDYTDADFKAKLAKGLKYMAENPGIYAIHCQEGKDRTGVVCALLESFMGASQEEIEADYMLTFYNYYGVKPGDDKYDIIAKGNVRKNIQRLLGIDNLETVDLTECAAQYLQSIGLTDEEIEKLRANLAADHEIPLNKAA